MKALNLQQRIPRVLSRLGLPALVTAFLWLTRSNDVSFVQVFLALILIYIPWHGYMAWKSSRKNELPVFSMIAFMYCIYYVLPLFWEPQTISDIYVPVGRELSEASVTKALLMVVLGVSSLWLGMKIRLGRFFRPRYVSIELAPSRLSYVRIVLGLGCFLNIYDVSPFAMGEGGRQLTNLLVSVVPLLAFVVLLRASLRGEGTPIDRILMLMFVATRLFNSLSSGWLGVSMSLILICGVVYLAERRRIPRIAFVLVVLFVLFFQVGKEDFRKTYWNPGSQGIFQGEERGGKLERASFWIQRSLERWNEALSDPTMQTLKNAVVPSVSRISLLNQTANVIDQTPSVVPYQYGALYSYLGVTLIPRAVWPDKPSMNEANQFYQVAYGLTTEDQLSQVSIAVGALTEGYINFSWPGVLAIMFLLGIFFDFYQTTFLSASSGSWMKAIGIVLLPPFLAIESQLAQYLGGIIQEVVIVMLVMIPALKVTRSHRRLMPLRTDP